MLVLTRKVSETISVEDARTGEKLGNIVVVSVLSNNQIKIGLDKFPEHIRFVRHDAKKGDKRAS